MNKYQNSLCYIDSILLDEDVLRIFDSPNYPPLIKDHIKIIQELVDKETPLTVNYIADGYADGYPVYDTATCPNCIRAFELDYEEHYKYCPNCGQRLNWEVKNEE